jgi:hypothetical protein
LAGFQQLCCQRDKFKFSNSGATGGEGDGKRRKVQPSRINYRQENANDDDDEVPPQLLRLARFFHYRWIPIKRALLRPIMTATGTANEQTTKNSSGNVMTVEIGLHYRLRLAKACWKYGLIAAAEYEMLLASSSLNTCNKQKNEATMVNDNDCNENDKSNDDDDDDCNKNCNHNESEDQEKNLMERTRLALLRLPTDVIVTAATTTATTTDAITTTSSMSYYPTSTTMQHSKTTAAGAVASASWRHAKEMILECCKYWEKNGLTTSTTPTFKIMSLPSSSSISKVVDWALTSWTALLLLQGVDCFTTSATAATTTVATSLSTMTSVNHPSTNTNNNSSSSNNNNNSNNNDQISKIEKEFALLLSNRSHATATANYYNSDLNLLQPFVIAVSDRINEILSYHHLQQMNGIHVLSMSRLLAMFHCRNHAEEHILTSVISCSYVMMKDGLRGKDCLDILSRLLAVYCCNLSIIADGDDGGGGGGGGGASEDSCSASSRTTIGNLEKRLYQHLNDEEFVDRVLTSLSNTTEEGGYLIQRDMVVSRAKSFMEVIFSVTAHLIRFGG